MIKLKPLLMSLFISLGVGALSGALINSAVTEIFPQLDVPPLTPPSWIFPIAWTILYILMGISAYLIYETGGECSKPALVVYGVQLFFNFFWSILFFNMEAYLFAFIWLVVLWVLIAIMIVLFYRCNKIAAYLQIPYLLWVTFAGYLNLMIWLLNK